MVGFSGYIVMTTIVILVVVALLVTGYVRGRYRSLSADVRRNGGQVPPMFQAPILNQIARELRKRRPSSTAATSTPRPSSSTTSSPSSVACSPASGS